MVIRLLGSCRILAYRALKVPVMMLLMNLISLSLILFYSIPLEVRTNATKIFAKAMPISQIQPVSIS